MKLLHIADLHLGAKNSGLAREKQLAIKEKSLQELDELFCDAKKDFDCVLICGDLFHTKSVTNKLKNSFFACVKNFDKPVLYVSGNHDQFAFDSLDLPENFVILDKNRPYYDIDNFRFYFQDEKTIKEFYDKDKRNVLLIHGNIKNKADNDFVDIEFLKGFKFDYVAMGHLHTFEKMSFYDMPFVYSGSLFSNGFDECGDKGYVAIEIDSEVKFSFKPFAKRRYMICNCDISNANSYNDIISLVSKNLKADGITTNDIVKVVLQGYYDENLDKNLSLLKDEFDQYFDFCVVDKSKLNIDIDKYKNEKLSFKAEFINLVESSSEDEENKNLVCKLGIEALKGEDLSI